MGKYAGLMAQAAENLIEGSSFKANGEVVTISEEKMQVAKDALSETIRGLMRDCWQMSESAEGSLEKLDGEVKIEDLMDKTNDGSAAVPSLGESMQFDIKSLVESLMEDPSNDGSIDDGDDEMQKAAIGHDDAGMGGDLSQDGTVDEDPGMMGGGDDQGGTVDEDPGMMGGGDDLGGFGALDFSVLADGDTGMDDGMDATGGPNGDMQANPDDDMEEVDPSEGMTDEFPIPPKSVVGESKKQPLAKMRGMKR